MPHPMNVYIALGFQQRARRERVREPWRRVSVLWRSAHIPAHSKRCCPSFSRAFRATRVLPAGRAVRERAGRIDEANRRLLSHPLSPISPSGSLRCFLCVTGGHLQVFGAACRFHANLMNATLAWRKKPGLLSSPRDKGKARLRERTMPHTAAIQRGPERGR
ncbi:hypothetical protein MRX96_010382 [Rhipicephalus microplus]